MKNYLIEQMEDYLIKAEFDDTISSMLIATGLSTIYLSSMTLIAVSLSIIILNIWLTK